MVTSWLCLLNKHFAGLDNLQSSPEQNSENKLPTKQLEETLLAYNNVAVSLLYQNQYSLIVNHTNRREENSRSGEYIIFLSVH